MNENSPSFERAEFSNPHVEQIDTFKTAHTVEDEDTGTKVEFKYVTVTDKEDGQIDRVSEGVGIQSLEDFKFEENDQDQKVMKLGRSFLTDKADANASARLLSRHHGEIVVDKDGTITYKHTGKTNSTRVLIPFGAMMLKENDSSEVYKKATYLLPLDFNESNPLVRYQLAVVVSKEQQTAEQEKEAAIIKAEKLKNEIVNTFERGDTVFPNIISNYTNASFKAANENERELYYELHKEIDAMLHINKKYEGSELVMVDGGRVVKEEYSHSTPIFIHGVEYNKLKELVTKRADNPNLKQDIKSKLISFINSIEPTKTT